MDNETLLALIDSIIDDAIKNIQLLEGQQGPRGLKGKDGNDFSLEDHKQNIISLIESHSNITLTSEQIESLKGSDGIDGLNGKDGTSISFEDVIDDLKITLTENLNEMRGDLKLNFSDLSEEDKDSLRGSRGQKGKAGRDFLWEENVEEIANLIENQIHSIKDFFKLRYTDLTDSEIESLIGPKGPKGRDGTDFDFEEHREEISNIITPYIDSIKEDIKLKFSSLNEEEKNSLKLKFSDLTEEDLTSIKGKRGQKGKPGLDGESGLNAYELSKFQGTLEEWIESLKGTDGRQGLQGLPGAIGPRGFIGTQGEDGRDGKDAPIITDIELKEDNDYLSLDFRFSDGEIISTNEIKLPNKSGNNYYYGGGGGLINFSYNLLPIESTLTIPENQQMIVVDGMDILGSLIIEGELCLI